MEYISQLIRYSRPFGSYQDFLDRWLLLTRKQGPSWPWSYGSWIKNNLCNQCLSPLMLRVRMSIRARCTTLCDKVLSVTWDRSVVFSGSSGFH
jgi:hypothetical protein